MSEALWSEMLKNGVLGIFAVAASFVIVALWKEYRAAKNKHLEDIEKFHTQRVSDTRAEAERTVKTHEATVGAINGLTNVLSGHTVALNGVKENLKELTDETRDRR